MPSLNRKAIRRQYRRIYIQLTKEAIDTSPSLMAARPKVELYMQHMEPIGAKLVKAVCGTTEYDELIQILPQLMKNPAPIADIDDEIVEDIFDFVDAVDQYILTYQVGTGSESEMWLMTAFICALSRKDQQRVHDYFTKLYLWYIYRGMHQIAAQWIQNVLKRSDNASFLSSATSMFSKNFTAAIEILENARANQPHDSADLRYTLGALAISEMQLGNYDKAEAIADELINMPENSLNFRPEAMIQACLAKVRIAGEREDIKQAHKWIETGLTYVDQTMNPLHQRTYLLNVAGLVEYGAGNKDKALELYKEALSLVNETGEATIALEIYFMVAKISSEQEDYTNAIAIFKQCVALAEQLGDVQTAIRCLSAMHHCYYQTDDLAGTKSAQKRAQTLIDKITDPASRAALLLILAKNSIQTNSRLTITYCQQAMQLFHELDDFTQFAWVAHELGVFYLKIGQLHNAITAYQKGLTVAPDDNDVRTVLIFSILAAFALIGDTKETKAYLNKLESSLNEDNNSFTAITLRIMRDYSLANLAAKQNDLDTAIELHQKVLKNITDAPELLLLAGRSASELGFAWLGRDLDKSREMFLKAQSIGEEINNGHLKTFSKVGHANVFVRQNDFEAAREIIAPVLQQFHHIETVAERVKAFSVASTIYLKLGDKSQALSLIQQMFDLVNASQVSERIQNVYNVFAKVKATLEINLLRQVDARLTLVDALDKVTVPETKAELQAILAKLTQTKALKRQIERKNKYDDAHNIYQADTENIDKNDKVLRLIELGKLAAASKNYEAAREHYHDTLELNVGQDQNLRFDILWALGYNYKQSHLLEKARVYLDEALFIATTLNADDKKQQALSHLATIAEKQDKPLDALTYSEELLALQVANDIATSIQLQSNGRIARIHAVSGNDAAVETSIEAIIRLQNVSAESVFAILATIGDIFGQRGIIDKQMEVYQLGLVRYIEAGGDKLQKPEGQQSKKSAFMNLISTELVKSQMKKQAINVAYQLAQHLIQHRQFEPAAHYLQQRLNWMKSDESWDQPKTQVDAFATYVTLGLTLRANSNYETFYTNARETLQCAQKLNNLYYLCEAYTQVALSELVLGNFEPSFEWLAKASDMPQDSNLTTPEQISHIEAMVHMVMQHGTVFSSEDLNGIVDYCIELMTVEHQQQEEYVTTLQNGIYELQPLGAFRANDLELFISLKSLISGIPTILPDDHVHHNVVKRIQTGIANFNQRFKGLALKDKATLESFATEFTTTLGASPAYIDVKMYTYLLIASEQYDKARQFLDTYADAFYYEDVRELYLALIALCEGKFDAALAQLPALPNDDQHFSAIILLIRALINTVTNKSDQVNLTKVTDIMNEFDEPSKAKLGLLMELVTEQHITPQFKKYVASVWSNKHDRDELLHTLLYLCVLSRILNLKDNSKAHHYVIDTMFEI